MRGILTPLQGSKWPFMSFASDLNPPSLRSYGGQETGFLSFPGGFKTQFMTFEKASEL